jgi:multiple sugar transport system substrate-binding protein
LWDAAEKFPETWEDVRLGGRKIKFLHGPAVGIGLSRAAHDGPLGLTRSDHDGRRCLEAILFSFGGSLQNAGNRPALKSRQTLDALKFFKALYEEAMSTDVLSWSDITANDRAMLAGEISLTMNRIDIIRTGEHLQLPVAAKLAVAKVPQGPVQRLGPATLSYNLGIWQFADNGDGAKQFLVDLIGNSREVLLASEFSDFPCCPQTVPDIAELLAADAQAQPPDKYRLLADAADWTAYSYYPGYLSVATDETVTAGLLQRMFTNAATGKMTPEEALTQADQEIRRIYQKWQDLGKI